MRERGAGCCCAGFPLVAANDRYSSCDVQASRCGGFSPCGTRALELVDSVVVAPGIWSTGLIVVVAHRLSSFKAWWIIPD